MGAPSAWSRRDGSVRVDPEGQEPPLGSALRHGVALAQGAVVPWIPHWRSLAKGDEVMSKASQVAVCQDEAESPCQLGKTRRHHPGHSLGRGIQKHGKNWATICRCELLLSHGKLQILQNIFFPRSSLLLPCLAARSCHPSSRGDQHPADPAAVLPEQLLPCPQVGVKS